MRVAVEGGGCSGFQYEIKLDAAEDDDLVLEKGGERVLVDQVSLPFLAGAVIDFTEELIGARFTIEKPKRHQFLWLRHQLFHVIGARPALRAPDDAGHEHHRPHLGYRRHRGGGRAMGDDGHRAGDPAARARALGRGRFAIGDRGCGTDRSGDGASGAQTCRCATCRGWGSSPPVSPLVATICCSSARCQSAGVGIGTAITIGSAPIWATAVEALQTRRAPAPSACWVRRCRSPGSRYCRCQAGARGRRWASRYRLGAGACYAAYSLITSRIGHRAHSTAIAAATFAVAAAMALPVLAVTPLNWAAAPAPVAALLFLGVGATGLSYALYTWGLGRVPASTGVTLALAEPVTAWLLALVIIGEAVTLRQAFWASV